MKNWYYYRDRDPSSSCEVIIDGVDPLRATVMYFKSLSCPWTNNHKYLYNWRCAKGFEQSYELVRTLDEEELLAELL